MPRVTTNIIAPSLHNLARIRDRRVRTKHLEPRYNLVCTVMPAGGRNHIPSRLRVPRSGVMLEELSGRRFG